MPHIVLEGPVDLDLFYTTFRPTQERGEGAILKIQDIFISRDKKTVLLEAIAIEDGPPQRFFIQVVVKDSRTTIRIYPGTDPEKTPGVKKLLAIVAKLLQDQHKGMPYGSTNLREFLR